MLDEAESSRRRELQRKAYAPGGGVSEAELAELRSLDARAADSLAEHPSTAPAQQPETADFAPAVTAPAEPAPAEPIAQVTAERGPEPTAVGEREEPIAQPRRRRRPGIPILVLSTLVALLLGFGGGWMLLSRSDAPRMTATQASAMAEIEKTARFDPGSIVYLGEKYNASVWRATAEDGAKICLAIHVVDKNEYLCSPPPEGEGPYAQPVGVSLDRVDGDAHWSYWATLVADIAGREVLIVQRHDMSEGFDWRSQFSESELAQIDILAAHGAEAQYLQVVGYDGEVPVFLSQGMRRCVYVVDPASDGVAENCDPVDGVFSLTVGATTYDVRETENRGPMLTVLRNGG